LRRCPCGRLSTKGRGAFCSTECQRRANASAQPLGGPTPGRVSIGFRNPVSSYDHPQSLQRNDFQIETPVPETSGVRSPRNWGRIFTPVQNDKIQMTSKRIFGRQDIKWDGLRLRLRTGGRLLARPPSKQTRILELPVSQIALFAFSETAKPPGGRLTGGFAFVPRTCRFRLARRSLKNSGSSGVFVRLKRRFRGGQQRKKRPPNGGGLKVWVVLEREMKRRSGDG